MKKRGKHLWEWTILLIMAGIFFLWGFVIPPVYDDTFPGELKYKYEKLRSASGKKLIVTGGSGAAFGVDTSLLQEAFPEYETVNFGMYAGLGSMVMLNLLKSELREGDIVIFMPEQEKQMLSEYFDPEYFWQAADGAPELLYKAGREYLGQLLGQYPVFASQKARRFWLEGPVTVSGIYARASFDEKGDMTAACEGNCMAGGSDPNMPIRFDLDMPTETFFTKVNALADEAQRNGAVVYYHFCPMNALAVEETDNIDAYCDALQDRMQIRLLGNPQDAILEPEWFYDTNFHLNTSGKRVFTAQLIQDLKAELLDSSPTEIQLPKMPEMTGKRVTEGDNSDAGYFTFEISEDTAELTGLTEEGKTRKRLCVPVTLGGCQTESISAEVFSGNTVLEEVVIQDNIRRIDDGSFMGMTKLKKIILTNKNPQDCLIGQGLLDGTDADVYVPKEALSDYKSGYYWSMYASRLK